MKLAAGKSRSKVGRYSGVLGRRRVLLETASWLRREKQESPPEFGSPPRAVPCVTQPGPGNHVEERKIKLEGDRESLHTVRRSGSHSIPIQDEAVSLLTNLPGPNRDGTLRGFVEREDDILSQDAEGDLLRQGKRGDHIHDLTNHLIECRRFHGLVGDQRHQPTSQYGNE